MYCRICGSEDESVRYYATKRQSLCRSCSADTPAKVGREAFDRKYWASEDVAETPPCDAIRREFYADYLASSHGSIESYMAATISPTM